MKRVLKKISAFLIAAGTLSTMIAPAVKDVSAEIAMASEYFECTSNYIPRKTKFTVKISKASNTHYLVDSTRSMRCVDLTTEGRYSTGQIQTIPVRDESGIAKFTGTPNDLMQQKLATLYNVEAVYDQYATIGFSDFGSSTGAPLYVGLIDEPGAAYSAVSNIHIDGNIQNDNASNLIPFTMVSFGKKGTSSFQRLMSADRDIVGHEMTHIFLKKRLGWYSDDGMGEEARALMEAYCDVLGELFDDNADWKIGADSYSSGYGYSVRDLANPSATKSPNADGSLQTGSFYTNYALYCSDLESGKLVDDVPGSGVRTVSARISTIISHTAYMMNQSGISRSDLAQIWYKSISNYNTNYARQATFEDCRLAVTLATDEFYKSRGYSAKARMEKLEIVNNAFDSARIYLSTSAKRYLTYPLAHTTARQNTSAHYANMSNFVRAESMKYRNGKFWNSDNVNSYTSTNMKSSLIYANGITACPTFFKGYNQGFDYNAEEPYYECAGFAKKLQMDYYGTTKFLQLNTESTYLPRIGDHLRIYLGGTPSFLTGHSIFITSVNGSTITYADCNANGNNNIAWGKTATITNNNGSLNIKLGSASYNFLWVERPIMLGDVNGDSYVNQDDVNLLKKIVSYGTSYMSVYNCNLAYRNFVADVNKDGKINANDTTLLTNAIKSTSGVNLEFVK